MGSRPTKTGTRTPLLPFCGVGDAMKTNQCTLCHTGGPDAVNEGLHLVVTLGFISVEVRAGTDDAPAPVAELAMGFVLLLPVVICTQNTTQ